MEVNEKWWERRKGKNEIEEKKERGKKLQKEMKRKKEIMFTCKLTLWLCTSGMPFE